MKLYPPNTDILKLRAIIRISCLFFFFTLATTLCKPPGLAAQEWGNTYATQYVTIYYSKDTDLTIFTRNISHGFMLFSESQEKNPLLAKNRVDRIVDRVSQILDMYPPNLYFKISIYPSYKELELIYRSMGTLKKAPVAFYNHKTKTVYLSLNDVTEGVLAHEIAHVVINFFFGTPPPPNMQEILAQYVDKHLWDK